MLETVNGLSVVQGKPIPFAPSDNLQVISGCAINRMFLAIEIVADEWSRSGHGTILDSGYFNLLNRHVDRHYGMSQPPEGACAKSE